MRISLLLLASAAGLALGAGAVRAQTTYSWGNSGTTYFYSPGTSDTYSPNTPPPATIPDADAPQAQIAPAPTDPMFYRAPDSYSVYRNTPSASEPTYYYNFNGNRNLGQGSGIEDGIGR